VQPVLLSRERQRSTIVHNNMYELSGYCIKQAISHKLSVWKPQHKKAWYKGCNVSLSKNSSVHAVGSLAPTAGTELGQQLCSYVGSRAPRDQAREFTRIHVAEPRRGKIHVVDVSVLNFDFFSNHFHTQLSTTFLTYPPFLSSHFPYHDSHVIKEHRQGHR
jgi:hypothetical protein